MEFSTESFALFFRLESVGISTTATVYKRLAHATLCDVVIHCDSAIAITRIDWCQADRTLRLTLDKRSYGGWNDNGWRDGRRSRSTLTLARFPILEAILIALAAAVVELVAGIRTLVVIELLHEAVAWTDHFG